MPTPVVVPKATISMEEGTIVQWFKTPGQQVGKDDVLFELETDKAVLEVPSPAEGVLLDILVSKGTAAVEAVVGWIGEPGEQIRWGDELPKAAAVPVPAPPPHGSAPSGAPRRVIATPAARRRAAELGTDLATVQGSGPGGRIVEQDVERARPAPEPVAERKTLVRLLSTAWQSVPHIHVSREMDGSGLAAARGHAAGASLTDLLLFALARLLPDFPRLTQVWNGAALERSTRMDLAFAVDTARGVVAPVIRDAARLPLGELARQRKALAEDARAHRLRVEQMQGGVFTLSNLGMHEVDFFAPIINIPQTALLATGRLRSQPVVAGDAIAVGWRLWANLAVDHRAADGAYAAKFLAGLQRTLHALSGQLAKDGNT